MKEHDLCLEEYIQGIEDGTITPPAGVGREESGEPAEAEEQGEAEEPAEAEEDAGEGYEEYEGSEEDAA